MPVTAVDGAVESMTVGGGVVGCDEEAIAHERRLLRGGPEQNRQLQLSKFSLACICHVALATRLVMGQHQVLCVS